MAVRRAIRDRSALRVVPAHGPRGRDNHHRPVAGTGGLRRGRQARADVRHDPGRHRADAGRGCAAPGRAGCWPTSATRSSPPTWRGPLRSGMKGPPGSSGGPPRRRWDGPTPTASPSRRGRGSPSRSAPAPRARSGPGNTRITARDGSRCLDRRPRPPGSPTPRDGRTGSSGSRGTSPNVS